MILLHPSWGRLARFAAGGAGEAGDAGHTVDAAHAESAGDVRPLDARSRRRVARHLARCRRCRERVSWLRAQRAAMRAGLAGEPPAGAWQRIQRRIAAGERVVVPVADPVLAPAWRRLPGVAAGVVLAAAAAVAAAFLFGVLEADAWRTELHFEPAQPRPGDSIRVEYRSGTLLAGEDRLRLRAAFRTADTPAPSYGQQVQEVGTLELAGDGVHRGGFRLPEDAVYAEFALENLAGERIDHNLQRYWSLAVHAPDGRPELAALRQQFELLSDWADRLELGRRMVELYPDDPRAWRSLRYPDMQTVPLEERSLRSAHYRSRFEDFHRELADRPGLPADVIDAMIHWDNPREMNNHWSERLQREYPRHPRAVDSPLQIALGRVGLSGGLETYMELAEQAWAKAGDDPDPGHRIWLNNTIGFAQRTDDGATVARWAERILHHSEVSGVQWSPGYIHLLLRWPDQAETALRLAREYEARLRATDESARPLHVTRSAHARSSEALHRSAFALLADCHLAGGDTTAALQAVQTAAAEGWNTARFRLAANLLLATADTAGALRYYALLAADPNLMVTADSAEALGGSHFDLAAWTAWRAEGQARFLAAVFAGAANRRVRPGATVADLAGRRHSLDRILEGRPTVVAYMLGSQTESNLRRYVSELVELNEWLEPRGFRLIALKRWPHAAERRRLLAELPMAFPLYFDDQAEARDALQSRSWPSFYILDESARIIFEGTVRRGVAALQMRDSLMADGRAPR